MLFLNLSWTIISMYMIKNINSNRKKAADLQEFYDIYIFDIDKNEEIMYPKRDKYEIKNNRRFDDEKYYNIIKEKIGNIDIYNIQKSNIIYDKDMRKGYKRKNVIYGVVCILILFLVSTFSNLNIYKLSVTVILPSIYVMNYIITNIYNLSNEINMINEAECSINNIINSSEKMSFYENEVAIRKFQDFIYLKRKNWTMIPNWVYKLFLYKKNKYYEVTENNSIGLKINKKENLQNEAFNIEKSLKIVDFLSNYGQAEIVGSVANNLIIEKDIDIHLLTNNNIIEISNKVIKYLEVVKNIDNIRVEDYISVKKSICIIIETYKAWRIEIWISNDEKYVGFDLKNNLRRLLNKEKREIIMNIKRYYYDKGLLKGEMSTDIYKAVVFGKVRTVDEFKEYIIKNLNRV